MSNKAWYSYAVQSDQGPRVPCIFMYRDEEPTREHILQIVRDGMIVENVRYKDGSVLTFADDALIEGGLSHDESLADPVFSL